MRQHVFHLMHPDRAEACCVRPQGQGRTVEKLRPRVWVASNTLQQRQGVAHAVAGVRCERGW